jgi:PAS domain-containing protein
LLICRFEVHCVAKVPFMADAQLRDRDSDPHLQHRDDAGVDSSQRTERRQTGNPGDSPMDILTRLPAVVVLERIPVPSLAMGQDGIILFANKAFAEMVGYQQDRLAGSDFAEIFHTVPAEMTALSSVDALANVVLELQHCEGWTVRARMSKSALVRHDDPVLMTFENLTEQLWVDER